MTPIRRVLTMRRDFMANASHELRTPVAAIQGYAETLLRGGVPAPSSASSSRTIHRHARRLAGLVDDVLRLSELEDRPEGTIVRESVNVRGVASLVVDTVKARADPGAGGARARRPRRRFSFAPTKRSRAGTRETSSTTP
jgi:two-component system phosphate regulon sensor histidine kinase PhoR